MDLHPSARSPHSMNVFVLALALAPASLVSEATPETRSLGWSDAATAPGAPVAALPDWIHLYGDLRVRIEHSGEFDAAGNDRTRGRMRARAGANLQISEELKAEVRLSLINPNDANNVHIDFGGSGPEGQAGMEVGIDRLNFTWLPTEQLTLRAGKMGLPYVSNPVQGEYLWDGDIQPAGVYAEWRSGTDLELSARAGHIIVDENPTATEATMTTVQLGVERSNAAAGGASWALHSALSDWGGEDDYLASFAFAQTEEFLVWDTLLEVHMDDWTVAAEFIQNLDDESGQDTGLVLGASHGKGRRAGAHVFAASYFDFEENAFVSAVAQDHVLRPGTGGPGGVDGFEARWAYWWNDATELRFWVI